MMRYLNDHCLDQEGLFRLSGNQNEVDVERRKIDAWGGGGGEEDYPIGTDPHVMASLLKKYLRELPEPLLTYDLFDGLLGEDFIFFSFFFLTYVFLLLFPPSFCRFFGH